MTETKGSWNETHREALEELCEQFIPDAQRAALRAALVEIERLTLEKCAMVGMIAARCMIQGCLYLPSHPDACTFCRQPKPQALGISGRSFLSGAGEPA